MARSKTSEADLAEQLRRAIRESGISPYRLCAEASVDRAMMSRFLTGKRTITLATAGRITACLGLVLRPTRKPKRRA